MINSGEPRRYRFRHREPPVDAWVAGEGPPAVLLHGWGLSGAAYRDCLRALASEGYRAIAPSVATLPQPWSLKEAATVVAEVLAALDAMRAPVFGHSLGGLVAVRLAVDHPDFVASLVPIDSPLVVPNRRNLRRLALPGPHFRVATHIGTATAFFRTLARRGGAASLAAAAREVLDGRIGTDLEALRAWATPAAIMWAEHDTLLPLPLGKRAARLLGCPLEIVRAGDGWTSAFRPDHDWPLRAPRLFARRATDLLAQLLPRQSSSGTGTGTGTGTGA